MEDGLQRHRIDVREYYRMAELELLAPDARVELIEGVIVDMAPMGSQHSGVIVQLNRALQRAVADQGLVLVQAPIRLNDFSEPQPDLALASPRADHYKAGHPTAEEVFLVVEVSKTTLQYDRDVKGPLYARHGIREFWIVDLENRQLRLFRKPAAGSYTDLSLIATPGPTAIEALPGVTVDLSGLFA